jgi:CheY-like chemotaxis protein
MAKKILVVEDHEMNRVLLRDLLQYHGYKIIEATNGEEAIKEAGAHLPDLIFMDIQMPVMNGYDAIKALKSDDKTKHIIIVALTSFAMTGDQDKSLATGANYYITKPIDTVALPKMVAQWLKEAR